MSKYTRVERKLRRKKIGLITVLTLFLTSTLLILLTKTSLFNISQIIVEGNLLLNHDRVVMASGVLKGENIFQINLTEIEENLSHHPYIKNSNVSRVIPNKISIKIQERKKIAVIPHVGSYIYLDNEGIVLDILSMIKEESILEIQGVEVEKFTIGQEIVLKSQLSIDKILEFIQLSDRIAIREDIETMIIDENLNITLHMKHGREVAFGGLNDVKYKLSYLLSILKDLEERNIEKAFIDFTKGSRPIVDTALD